MATPTAHSIPVDGGLLHVGVWPGDERVVLGDRAAAVLLVDGGIPLPLPSEFDPFVLRDQLMDRR